MKSSSRWRSIGLAILAGLATRIVLGTLLLNALYNTGWGKLVGDWLLGKGMPNLAADVREFCLYVPAILLNIVGGAVIGYFGYRRWTSLTVAFGLAFFLTPYISSPITGPPVTFWIQVHGIGVVLETALYEAAIIPLTVVAGWLTARASPRRIESISYPGCTHCGYNLTGNVSGVCPECGGKV
jgi:hypothetical protein